MSKDIEKLIKDGFNKTNASIDKLSKKTEASIAKTNASINELSKKTEASIAKTNASINELSKKTEASIAKTNASIENLAAMTLKGFERVDDRLNKMDGRLDHIENLLIRDNINRIERLEDRMAVVETSLVH